MASPLHPSPAEVERQLDRILADEVVASHAQPARLLKFIVERAIKREEVTEKLIRECVFPNPPYKEDSNIARVTMDKVRKLLAEYYEGEGADDPVIIALPASPEGRRIKFQAGKAYTPGFTYNPRAPIAKQFAIAHRLMLGGAAQLEQSRKELQAIEDVEPGHGETALAFAEVTGCQLLLGVFIEEGRAPLLAGLFGLLRMHESSADPWRLHNIRGLLRLCAGEMREAEAEFESALKLDRRATVNRGWYAFYLFAAGRREQALGLFAVLADEDAANAQVQALYGMYLCRAGRHQEAERTLAEALALDRNCIPAHLGMVQLGIETGRKPEALLHAQRLKELVEPSEFEQLIRMFSAVPPQDREQ